MITVESPRYKQNNWRDLHLPSFNSTSLKKFQLPSHTDKIISAAFISRFPDVNVLFTGTEKGNVYVWDTEHEGDIYQTGEHSGSAASNILVTSIDNIDNVCILQNAQENARIYIYAYKMDTKSLFYKDMLSSRELNQILFVLDSSEKFLGVGERTLIVWNKKYYRFDEMTYKISENENERSVSAVVTRGHEYLFVGTNFNMIYRWDVIAGKWIDKFKNNM